MLPCDDLSTRQQLGAGPANATRRTGDDHTHLSLPLSLAGIGPAGQSLNPSSSISAVRSLNFWILDADIGHSLMKRMCRGTLNEAMRALA